MGLFVKRIYDLRAASDGYRVLVDQLWPREIARDKAGIDEWIKDLAPTGRHGSVVRHVLREAPCSVLLTK
jgi:uncharacterized protein YeaO (DUF488 family)